MGEFTKNDTCEKGCDTLKPGVHAVADPPRPVERDNNSHSPAPHARGKRRRRKILLKLVHEVDPPAVGTVASSSPDTETVDAAGSVTFAGDTIDAPSSLGEAASTGEVKEPSPTPVVVLEELDVHEIVPKPRLRFAPLVRTHSYSDCLSVADSLCPSINTTASHGTHSTGRGKSKHNGSSSRSSSHRKPQTLPEIVTTSLWSDDAVAVLRGMKDARRLLAQDLRQQGADPRPSCDATPNADEEEEFPNKLEFLWLGGHLALLHAMRNHSTNSDVQIQGSRVLFKLLKDVSVYWAGLFGTLGAVRLLVRAMHRFPTDLAVHESCSRTMYRLLACFDNASAFCGTDGVGPHHRVDGVSALLLRVESFPKDGQTQVDVCNMVKKLGAWDEIRDTLVERGLVTVVPTRLTNKSGATGDDHSAVSTSKTSTTSATTASMSDDSEGSEGNSDSSNSSLDFTSVVGVGILSAVLEEEEQVDDDDDPVILSMGPAIRKLTHQWRSHWHRRRVTCAVPPNQDDVLTDERLVSLVEAFTTDLCDADSEVVECALEQIDILLRQRSARGSNYAQVLMETGSPLALVSLLRRHSQADAKVLRLGCQVLRTVLQLNGMHVLLSDLDAIPAVLEGLKSHPSDHRLLKAGFKALLALLKRSSSSSTSSSSSSRGQSPALRAFLQADGASVAVQAVYGVPNKAHVQVSACKLLHLCAKASSWHPPQDGLPAPSVPGRATVVSALESVLVRHGNQSKAGAAASKALRAFFQESPFHSPAVQALLEEHPLTKS